MENQVGGVNDLSIISKLTTSDTETMKDITASGSVAAPKEEEDEWLCPTCGNKWGSDEGKYCSSSWHLATPLIQKQVARLQSELASLRQQLKERDEFMQALIIMSEMAANREKELGHHVRYERYKSTISRAKALFG